MAGVRGLTLAERTRTLRVAPELVFGLLLLVAGALLAWRVNARITYVILDETQLKASAVHYTSGLPGTLIHDVYARATSRLYSLLISPIIGATTGGEGVRIVRVVNVALFGSAVVPAYLIARRLIVSRWRVCAVATLCVVVPWVSYTAAVFTESLAYPLTLWCVYAMMLVLEAPNWRRDLFALAMLVLVTTTRTQHVALVLAYIVVLAFAVGGPIWSAGRGRARLGPALRDAARRVPVSAVAVVVLVLLVLGLLATGNLKTQLDGFLGTYAGATSSRTNFPADMGVSLLVEVLAITVGLGVVPVILGLAWYPRAWRRDAEPVGRAYALASAVAVGWLFVTTLYAQGGYPEGATEERYYFYAAPFVLLAAFAAWDRGQVDRRSAVWIGVALALVAAVLPLPRGMDLESTFFAPAMVSARYVVDQSIIGLQNLLDKPGGSERDMLALMILAITFATALAHRRWSLRALPAALALAAVMQVAVVTIDMVATTGGIENVPSRIGPPTPTERSVADRASGKTPVTWLDNEIRDSEPQAWFIQRDALFYNTFVQQRAYIPGLNLTPDTWPLNGLPLGEMRVDEATGKVDVAGVPKPVAWTLGTTDSPFFQIAGQKSLEASVYRLQAVRATEQLRLTWRATGLDVGGYLQPGQTAQMTGWDVKRVVLELQGDPDAEATLRVDGRRRKLAKPQDVRVELGCGRKVAELTAVNKTVRVFAVRVEPAATLAAGCPSGP